jgi:acetyl-CoA C-acetyltransferase
MGVLAQAMANKKNYTHEQRDEFAIRSLTRAQIAIQNNDLVSEISPVTMTSRKGEMIVTQDENPFNSKIEKIPTLRPAFAKDDTIKAANANSISDSASAIAVTSEAYAQANGLPKPKRHWHDAPIDQS